MTQQQTPTLDLQPDDVKSQRRIGKLGKHGVFELKTKGGYNLILTPGRGDGIPENGILGLGPHPAVARFLAEKNFPGMQLSELSKSWTDLSRQEMSEMLPGARRMFLLLQLRSAGE